MAINIPIVTEFVDAGLKSAQGAFDTFRTKVGEAEGGMGKFKAGAGVALDTVKANAGNFALAAGGAIAGFAFKAIDDFNDLAFAVDDFRNRTQLSLDQSSRWKSYTDDLGIEADAMIKVFDKLGKGASNQIPAFQELGVEIAFGPDGTTDIEETFLRVVDKLNSLEDPADRAKLSAELLGKGWQDVAEIVNMSSDDIRGALGAVGDFELIDEEEIQKAKDLREAQDRLGDALAEISVTIGEKLIPALTDATNAAVPLLDAIGPLIDVVFDGADANSDYATQISKSNSQMRIGQELASKLFGWLGIGNDETEDLADNNVVLADSLSKTVDEIVKLYDANRNVIVSLEDVDDALANLKGEVDERQAWRNLISEIETVKDKAIEAFVEGTPAAIRESEGALDNLRLELAEYITESNAIPTEKKTDFLARLETANLDQIEAIFNQLGRPRTVEFRPTVNGIPIGPGETPSEVLGRRSFNPTAGTSVVVNVAGSVVAENDLVESVRKGLVNSQRNGSQLVYTNK